MEKARRDGRERERPVHSAGRCIYFRSTAGGIKTESIVEPPPLLEANYQNGEPRWHQVRSSACKYVKLKRGKVPIGRADGGAEEHSHRNKLLLQPLHHLTSAVERIEALYSLVCRMNS